MPAVSHTIQLSTVTGPLLWILIGLILFLFLTTILSSTLYLLLRRRHRHHQSRPLPHHHHAPTIPLSTIRATPSPAKFHTPPPRPSASASPFRPAHKPHPSPATIASATTLWPRPPPSPLHHAIYPPSRTPTPPPKPTRTPPRPTTRPLTRTEQHARHAALAALARAGPDPRAALLQDSIGTDTSEMDVERRGPAVNAAYARYLQMRRQVGEGASVESTVLEEGWGGLEGKRREGGVRVPGPLVVRKGKGGG